MIRKSYFLISALIFLVSCQSKTGQKVVELFSENTNDRSDANPVYALLVSPEIPAPDEPFRVMATGEKNIAKVELVVLGSNGKVFSRESRTGNGLPFWRIDGFSGFKAGNYRVSLINNGKEVASRDFVVGISSEKSGKNFPEGWDGVAETLYSAWINALFFKCDDRSSWPSLHAVTQDKENNFLYNYLSMNEDDQNAKNRVIMQPDCADNPFFLRAYFAWKLGLPFGYHICDRGASGRSPRTGTWVTNQSLLNTKRQVTLFNMFLRNTMNGVHSGTARTALENDNSDYYPVPLTYEALRPGVVFADPYGHTLTIVKWISQTKEKPGILLSVDAQPDGTVGIKRFWKGNFMFNTSEVIGEPGFKAFRPIRLNNNIFTSLKNNELDEIIGIIPFSLQQQKMEREDFYNLMDRIINPNPLKPEEAFLNLIQALHEQLIVRVTSVGNGETYFKKNQGTVIPMPGNATGVFLTGGQWENYSTPNRDLRLLIAMDAVMEFPEKVLKMPGDFDISVLSSPEKEKRKLEVILDEKTRELTINYTRSDGSEKKLTLAEILKRKAAFEMAYNPNYCPEIRWGAPEGSEERSTCRRQASASQNETMKKVRKWFQQRLHPPT